MNNLCFMSNLNSSELASWVQAWGTIAAVAASAGLVLLQHWLQDRRELLAETKRRNELIQNRRLIVGYLALDLVSLLELFKKAEPVAGFVEFPNRAVEDLFTRLAQMEVDMSDGFSSEHVMLIRAELIAFDTRFCGRVSRHLQSLERTDGEFLVLKLQRARELLRVAREAHKSTAEYRWIDPG